MTSEATFKALIERESKREQNKFMRSISKLPKKEQAKIILQQAAAQHLHAKYGRMIKKVPYPLLPTV